MSADKLRVGFIGAGGNTRLRHLPGFARISGVELTAVANRTLASAESVAAEFGIAAARADWHEILADDDVDAVCIGTWPNTHAEMTCAALEAGKHVLVEARMADRLSGAEAMLASSHTRPEQVAQIVPSPFTLEADAIIKRLIETGSLGNLQEIHSHWSNDATADPAAPLHWRMDERISGINIMALGICYEPLLRWIPGDPTVNVARGSILTPQRLAADGSLASITIPEQLDVEGEWGGARLVMHQSSVSREPPRGYYRLVGDRGTLEYDLLGRRLEIHRTDEAAEVVSLPSLPDGGWTVESDFVNSIREGAPVRLTDFTTGLRYMRFTHEVKQAIQLQ